MVVFRRALLFGAAVLPLTLLVGLRRFVHEAFRIPSGGMFPTLLLEDLVFVSKLDFAFGAALPAYGEVIVFEFTRRESGPFDFIQRVVALPGDVIEVRNDDLIINGWSVPKCFVGVHEFDDVDYRISVEHLGERPFLVAHDLTQPPENWGPFTVPSNQVFMVGDNRLNSYDSRAWNDGAGAGVELGRIQGRATAIWYPIDRIVALSNQVPLLPRGSLHLRDALRDCLEQTPDSTLPPSRR